MNFDFRVGETESARSLVLKFHYSHRWPGASTRLVGTACDPDSLFVRSVAACVFGEATARWSEPVLELTRLVRDPSIIEPNLLTWLIAHTVRYLRQHLKDVDGFYPLLVSFASIANGHHGGVYQACSWNYHGEREPARDGLVINGKYIPARSCNSAWGTSSPTKLQELYPQWTIESHIDEGKHLYWLALNKKAEQQAARLELTRVPYPKPNKANGTQITTNPS